MSVAVEYCRWTSVIWCWSRVKMSSISDQCRYYVVLLSHLSLVTVPSSSLDAHRSYVDTDSDTAATIQRDRRTTLHSPINCPSSSSSALQVQLLQVCTSTSTSTRVTRTAVHYQLEWHVGISLVIFFTVLYCTAKYYYLELLQVQVPNICTQALWTTVHTS